MQLVAAFGGAYLRKSALPLKRSLGELDPARLLPEYRPNRVQPPPLSEELIENLGTREYLQLNLVDQERNRSDPTALAHVFITYHTGQPDPVPHNPEECRSAAGMIKRSGTNIEVSVPGPDGREQVIPVSVLEFELPKQEVQLSRNGRVAHQFVAYFFYANGHYATTRTGVRFAISNIWDRYAYYSKIEVSFSGVDGREYADRQQTIDATRRLLRKLMPILWEDHYQAWEAIEQGASPVTLER